jgi:hypothetical protein
MCHSDHSLDVKERESKIHYDNLLNTLSVRRVPARISHTAHPAALGSLLTVYTFAVAASKRGQGRAREDLFCGRARSAQKSERNVCVSITVQACGCVCV